MRVNYWEIIADNLKKAGGVWGCVSTLDCEGRTIWIADAHRDDVKRLRAVALTDWPDFCDPRRVANTMKMHVLLGLVLAGLLCSCAASTPHSGTATGTQQTVHTQAPLTPQVGPSRR